MSSAEYSSGAVQCGQPEFCPSGPTGPVFMAAEQFGSFASFTGSPVPCARYQLLLNVRRPWKQGARPEKSGVDDMIRTWMHSPAEKLVHSTPVWQYGVSAVG